MLSEYMRIKFTKKGRIRYTSHLDLQRTFKSGLIRARVPLWYSKGFNPHPKLVFALTVSVGAESECELLDVRLDGEMEREEAIKNLRASFTSEMNILDVYAPERPFSEIAYSGYKIYVDCELSNEEIDKMLDGAIVITRRTKSGEKTEDIRSMIHSVKYENGCVDAVLGAGNDRFLNPEYLVRALCEYTSSRICDYMIVRYAMYDKSLELFA